jgi:ankyrin repeat protein
MKVYTFHLPPAIAFSLVIVWRVHLDTATISLSPSEGERAGERGPFQFVVVISRCTLVWLIIWQILCVFGAPRVVYDAAMSATRAPAPAWRSAGALLFVLLLTFVAGARQRSRDEPPEVESFFGAIQRNDTNTVFKTLERDTNFTHRTWYGALPLHEAARRGFVGIVTKLLKSGADVNAQGTTSGTIDYHRTALAVAVRYNHTNVCVLLLQAGADPNIQSPFDGAPLHCAFEYRHPDIAGWLLDHGANPFLEKNNPYNKPTPIDLHVAIGDGKLVPRMLSEAPKFFGQSKRAPKRGGVPQARQMLAMFLASHGPSLLSNAAQRGELEAVQALLKAGVTANTNHEGIPIIHRFAPAAAAAARSTQFESARWQQIRELLVKGGAPYGVFAATALGELEQARRLSGVDKSMAQSRDGQGQTPLHWAVNNQQLSMTTFWLGAGASPAATNSAGQTALHVAAALGLVEHAKLLLAAQSPTTVRDTNGWTPLEAAIKAQQTETIRLLLTQRDSPRRADRAVALSIHEAAASGNVDALSALTETTDRFEARNELGLTPLQVAVQQGHLAAAALLVSRNADVNARDPEGDTLLHWVIPHLFGYSIRDRPPTNWLARVQPARRREAYLRALAVGEYQQAPGAILEATVFLLASGIDARATNRAGLTPVQIAADEKTPLFDDRAPVLKLLTLAGGKIDQADADGNTPLHLAGRDLIVDRMASLIASGADLDATNRQGRTPLHVYCETISSWDESGSNDNQPFQLLVKSKPNVNAQDNDGLTPLHILAGSASSFRSRAARLLLDAGAKPNLRDKLGRTALHVVAANVSSFEKANLTRALLDARADPNARDNLGRAPIHILLSQKWPWHEAGECVTMLAGAGADLSARDNDGKTPLHYLSALGGQGPLFFLHGVTDAFTKAKVDFQPRDNDGDTPAHVAAKTGTREVFDWLVKQGADLDSTNNSGETPRLLSARSAARPDFRGPMRAEDNILMAVRKGDLNAATRLLNKDRALVNQTNEFGQTPLSTAVLDRRTNVVELLEQYGVQWDEVSAVLAQRPDALRGILRQHPAAISSIAFGQSLLHLAVDTGNLEIIRLLLAANCDPNTTDSWGLSPLGRALLKRHTEAARLLVEHGAAENFFDAIYAGDLRTAKALFAKEKSLLATTNSFGAVPVEIAAGMDRVDILKFLLANGVSASSANVRDGMTPLHFAAMFNQTNSAQFLIRRGAIVEAYDSAGLTPLHSAVTKGARDTTALLLKHKANPNSVVHGTGMPRHFAMGGGSLTGGTALHIAALNARTNVIPILLMAGAAINAANSDGSTPLDLTERIIFPGAAVGNQRSSIKPSEPLTLAALAPQNSLASLNARQAAAAALLKAAGGKHSAGPARWGCRAFSKSGCNHSLQPSMEGVWQVSNREKGHRRFDPSANGKRYFHSSCQRLLTMAMILPHDFATPFLPHFPASNFPVSFPPGAAHR